MDFSIDCSYEKRRRPEASFRSTCVKPVYRNRTFKNGEFDHLDVSSKQGYIINVDFTDAYLTVPMHPDSQKFIRFLLGDKTFQFTAMPFGLNLTPQALHKNHEAGCSLTKESGTRGVRLIIYLDDILIIASSIETLNHHKTLAIDLLESLGFLINYKKSNPTPSQQIVFLGMLVDSASMQFILPQAKSVQIQKECRL